MIKHVQNPSLCTKNNSITSILTLCKTIMFYIVHPVPGQDKVMSSTGYICFYVHTYYRRKCLYVYMHACMYGTYMSTHERIWPCGIV